MGDCSRAGARPARVAALALLSLCSIGIFPAEDRNASRPSRFTIGHVRFNIGGYGWMGYGRQGPPWSHDWPRGTQHLMKIMAEVTRLDANPDGRIVSFDSEEIFRYPIAYMCEVGFLDLTPTEAKNMREYLLRGGFLIVDDFREDRSLEHFKEELKKVFSDRYLEELPRSHSVFNCFYDISDVFPIPPYSRSLQPRYLGMADDYGRLMIVVNFNNDLSEYWEYPENPFRSLESSSNEAFKYGVNYLLYALAH